MDILRVGGLTFVGANYWEFALMWIPGSAAGAASRAAAGAAVGAVASAATSCIVCTLSCRYRGVLRAPL